MGVSTADRPLPTAPPSGLGVVHERPSVDEWIIGRLQEKGSQTLDQMADSLPEVNWAQFFLAVDRLSRSGRIMLWHRHRGDYVVSLKEADTVMLVT
ncbi:MAG TPA: hypothetical protein VJ692_01565 [Nitrospiraceae bacterium]|nr:hypothetical protein [Nitrospiraceae bacterium]